jgi:hypothetical protein
MEFISRPRRLLDLALTPFAGQIILIIKYFAGAWIVKAPVGKPPTWPASAASVQRLTAIADRMSQIRSLRTVP